jgi:hypothetical protein
MKAYSGSTSEGFLPPTASTGTGSSATAVAPAPEDPSATFADHLQQEQKNAPPTTAITVTWANLSSQVATTPVVTPPAVTLPVSVTATPVTPSTVTTPLITANIATPDPTNVPPTAFLALRGVNAMVTPTAKTTPPAPAATMKTAPQTDETDETTSTTTSSKLSKTSNAPMPLAMIMAHAAILAAATRGNGATNTATTASAATTSETTSESDLESAEAPAFSLPIFPFAGKSATTSIAEKKSAGTTPERSFIQADGGTSASLAMVLGLGLTGLTPVTQDSSSQSVTTKDFSSLKSMGSASTGGLASAGMANGKKDGDMNATLEMPSLIASTGTNPMVSRTSADVHILLGSNKDFQEALEQVVHVADLSNLSRVTPPLRVAIEIQTPPGAIVNVYVSRQADSYRAQLSTDDPIALGWVQSQISSLKTSSDTGVAVKWLPAQLETSPASASSTSTGSDRNLDWNRGQNQSGYQQDERQQSQRQKRESYSDDSSEAAVPFLATFGALGGAA